MRTQADENAREARRRGEPLEMTVTLCTAPGCGCLLVPAQDVYCGHIGSSEKVRMVRADAARALAANAHTRELRRELREVEAALIEAEIVLGNSRAWTLTPGERERWNEARLRARAALEG